MRRAFRKHRVFMIVFTLLFMVVFSALMFFLVPERYEAKVTLTINNQGAGVTNENYDLDRRLVEDYSAISKSRRVLENTIQKSNSSMTMEQLRNRLIVQTIPGTNLITITAYAETAEQAVLVGNAAAESLKEEIYNIYKIDNIQIIDYAREPSEPKRLPLHILMPVGLVLAWLIAVVIILLMDYFDDTIRTVDQAMEIFDAPVLGQIPHGITRLRKKKRKRKK